MMQTPAENVSPTGSVGSMQETKQVVDHLLAVMDAMLEVVDEETSLVRAGKLSAAARLVPSKQELSQLYVTDTQRLKASQPFLARTAPDILTALRKRHDLFQAILQMNLTVLATAHAVSEGIMRGVSDELARKSAPSVYGATGRAVAPQRREAQPLALSRVL
jgi:flagellar biosynthesis/type III secretory pathway chaperone